MKKRLRSKTKTTSIEIHEKIVDRITRDLKPMGMRFRPVLQWFFWLGASLVVMILFWMRIGLQANVLQVIRERPHLLFILTAFVGAALAAWEAIASSIPGRQTGKFYKSFEIFVLIALFSIPFLFFIQSGSMDLGKALRSGSGCEEGVALSGLIPWILMGWLLSRNATFHPWWTGLWSGVCAFLMGTITLQIHCSNWNANHVLMAHLLPAAVGTFAASLLGSFWFSRWKKQGI